MKKIFYLGLCAVLAMGVGCALSNYELITDNDQVSNGKGSGIVNTNGKAHVRPSSQIALIWPDGSDDMIWFVDQNAAGDRTLTTYNNFSTSAGPTFFDDLYCTPDRQGCVLLSASDPEVGDVDPYDYNLYNPNCAGARSLYYVFSTTRYYGECGRNMPKLSDRLSMLYMGTPTTKFGSAALRWDATPGNTTVVLDNLAGFRQMIPMTGSISATITGRGTHKGALDLTNPALRAMGDYAANFMQNYGSRVNQVSFTYNGIEFKHNLAPLKSGQSLRNYFNTRF